MSPFRLTLVSFTMICAVLLWTAPATLLDAAMNKMSSGRMRVASVSGSLWSGSGQLEIRNSAGAAVFASKLDWRLNKFRLLRGQLSVSYHAFNHPVAGTVQLGLNSLRFSDIHADLPAAAMTALIPAAQGYGLGGSLNLSSESVNFTRTTTVGNVVLRWQNASSSLAPVAPLGSYHLHLVGNPAPLQFNGVLTTLRGPVQLDGSSTLGITQRTPMQLIALLPDSEYAELAPFLRLIGIESAGKRFLIEI